MYEAEMVIQLQMCEPGLLRKKEKNQLKYTITYKVCNKTHVEWLSRDSFKLV